MASDLDERAAHAGQVTGTGVRPRSRWFGPVVTLIAVLPIWVAVIRAGVQGLFPYSDAAATVLRAQDVFDGAFPLAGMPAAAGSVSGYQVYFPGAWQLYAIAIPTRLFGVVWGPLLAMGLLNTLWVVLACWLLFRRLRPVEAMASVALLTALLWSLGSGFLISPVPMQMVIIPTALLLVAAWLVSTGEVVALPVLALVANYLWLDHLVLVVIVPVVTVCAVLGAWLSHRRTRGPAPHRDSEHTPGARRSVVAAGIITLVMWIPPVIQQFTVSPGNLRLLFASSGTERPIVGAPGTAIHYVVGLVTQPWFWLRGTLEDPPYLYIQRGPFVVAGLSVRDLVAAVVLIGVLVALGVAARRRHDALGWWLVIMAGVAMVAAVVTAHSAPTSIGPPVGYLWSVWAIAMFVWLAIGVNVLRLVHERLPRFGIAPVLGIAFVFTVLNLPAAGHGYGSDGRQNDVVRSMNAQVVPRVEGHGTFQLQIHGIQDRYFGDALVLAMRDAGVGYCFPEASQRSDGSRPACPADIAGTIVVHLCENSDSAAGEVLFRQDLLTTVEQHELARLDTAISEWLATTDRVQLSAVAIDKLDHVIDASAADPLADLVGSDVVVPAQLVGNEAFEMLVGLWYGTPRATADPLLRDAPLTAAQWRNWVLLKQQNKTLIVTEQPGSSR